MNRHIKNLFLLVTMASMSVIYTQANAGMITFDSGWQSTSDNPTAFPTPTVIVNDETAGWFEFDITIGTSDYVGTLSGFGLGFSSTVDNYNGEIKIGDTLLGSSTLNYHTDSDGSGFGSFNGLHLDLDIAVTNDNDLKKNPLPLTIWVSNTGSFDLSELNLLALRFQQVGYHDLGNGSAKIYAGPTVVPEPAPLALLSIGLIALAFRKKK